MEVYFAQLDWNAACERAAAGTFQDDCLDDDQSGSWLFPSDYDDVLATVLLMGEVMDSIAKHCSESNRQSIANSIGKFFTESASQWNEIPTQLDPETYWLVLSPTTVASLHANLAHVDFSDLEQQYNLHAPQDAKRLLGYSSGDFTEHLQAWATEFEAAANAKRGFVVSVG